MCPRASPIPAPFREAARRFALPPRRLSQSKTAARAPVRRGRAGLYVIGYAPDGIALAGSNRTITELTDILALFKA